MSLRMPFARDAIESFRKPDWLLTLVVTGGMTILVWFLVRTSTYQPALGTFCIGVAGFVALTTWLGADRLGQSMLVGALGFAPIISTRVSLSFVTISDVLLVLSLICLAPRLLRARIHVPMDYLIGCGLVFVFGLVATLAGDYTSLGLVRIARMIVTVLVLPMALLALNPSQRRIHVLCLAYVLGQTVSTVFPLITGTGGSTSRFLGLSVHPNAFAICSLIALGMTYYLGTQLHGRWSPFLVGLAAVNVVGLMMSGSRGALIALGVALIVIPLVERSGRWLYVVALLGAFLLTTPTWLDRLGPDSALNRLLNPSASSAAGSDQERTQLAHEGWHAFLQHPLIGSGFGGAKTFFYHNPYLQIGVAAGVVGMLGFFMMAICYLRILVKPGPLHRLGYCALGYFIALTFLTTIWDRFAWVPLAVVMLAHAPPDAHAEPTDDPAELADSPEPAWEAS